jgi:hypothetical protein
MSRKCEERHHTRRFTRKSEGEVADRSMLSGGHRKVGYTYHNMLMGELPVMTRLLKCSIG